MGTAPLVTRRTVVASYNVTIVKVTRFIGDINRQRPQSHTVKFKLHGTRFITIAKFGSMSDDVYRFAPIGAVVDIKIKLHVGIIFLNFSQSLEFFIIAINRLCKVSYIINKKRLIDRKFFCH